MSVLYRQAWERFAFFYGVLVRKSWFFDLRLTFLHNLNYIKKLTLCQELFFLCHCSAVLFLYVNSWGGDYQIEVLYIYYALEVQLKMCNLFLLDQSYLLFY